MFKSNFLPALVAATCLASATAPAMADNEFNRPFLLELYNQSISSSDGALAITSCAKVMEASRRFRLDVLYNLDGLVSYEVLQNIYNATLPEDVLAAILDTHPSQAVISAIPPLPKHFEVFSDRCSA